MNILEKTGWIIRLILPVMVALTISLQAQTDRLRFERIEGLSQSTGYAIMKDRQGFLWIATANGLNRYDGVEMKVYKPELQRKAGSMIGRIIRSELREDDQERIWFSTDVSLHSFDKKTEKFTTWQLPVGGKPAYAFGNPFVLEGNELWLANADEGLFVLNTETGVSIQYALTLKDESGNPIRLMYNGVSDTKGSFWFATNKGLLEFQRATQQWRRHLADRSLYSIAHCSDTLYLSEGKEILQVSASDIATGHAHITVATVQSPHERDLIHRVYSDGRSNVWVGDESGNVFCKPYGSQQFRWMGNINLGSTIRTNYPVYSFYADPNGILWTGAYMLGLMKCVVDIQPFSTFPRHDINATSENVFVNTFYEAAEDEVWLGTFQKGITILNRKTGVTRQLDLPGTEKQLVYGNSVHLIERDGRGNLWTGMSGSLFVKESGRVEFSRIEIPVPSNALQNPQVWCLTEYKDGWLVGTNIGLYLLKKEKEKFSMTHISWLGQQRITAIWIKDLNTAWIAFESGGILIARDPEQAQAARQLFKETNVTTFRYDDAHQLLWICTSNGLIAYHEPSGQHIVFSERNGLASSYIYSILQDSSKLWIGTQRGLFRADIQSVENSVLPEVTFTGFTHKDGLPDNQFNRGAAYRGAFSGDFFYGTIKGIVWFNPAQIRPNRVLPEMVLTKVAANDQVIDSTLSSEYTKSVSLSYDKNSLLFRFRGIEYINPAQVQYAYRLEGWDKDWIYNGTLNEVRYNNLPPGEYTFRIRSANESGLWNDKSYDVDVTIVPPFWATAWFYGFVSVVILGIVVYTTRRIAVRKLERKLAALEMQQKLDQERQRISREMHDDIGAGLTQIALLSEFAKSRSGINTNKELSDISNTSRQLVNSMGEIVWSLNPENSTLDHLLTYLREQLGRQLEYSGIAYTINFPEVGPEISISNELRRNILLVTKEIVNNSIKHSKAKHIFVDAELKNGSLSLRIRDDGSGFDVHEKYSGNGLKNIHDRIHSLNGKLEITSSPGAGSEFSYSIAFKS